MNQSDCHQLFVSGSSRSGTTLLSTILRRHTSIYANNEMHYFGDLFDLSADQTLDRDQLVEMGAVFAAREENGIWRAKVTDANRDWVRECLDQSSMDATNGYGLYCVMAKKLAQLHDKTLFCDHTPRNIFYASELLRNMPDARIIHMVRDPRAVLASQKSRWKRRWLDDVKIPLREVARNWVSFHPYISTRLWKQAITTAEALEQHPRFLILRYEDLVASPEAHITKLCHFMGLEFEDDMMNVPVAGSSHGTSRLQEKRITPEMVGKWKNSLKAHEITICERITQAQMRRFDYQPLSRADQSWLTTLRTNVAALGSRLTYPLHLAGAVIINPRRAFVQLSALMRSKARLSNVQEPAK